jgi:hypothetical protein
VSARADASRRVGKAVNYLQLPMTDRDIIGRLVDDTPGGFSDLPEWLRALVERAEAEMQRRRQ